MSKSRSVRVCPGLNPYFPGFQSGWKDASLQCSLDERAVHGWINRKGHEVWLLSGLEREKPFNFLDNLKPFTWKNYLNKGNWLHLLSRGIIVWTELKPYIYIILWHSPEEVETTPHSLYCLFFMPPLPVGGNTAMSARNLSWSYLPNSSCNSVLRSQMSQTIISDLKVLCQKKVDIVTIGVQVRTVRTSIIWYCSAGVQEVISNPHCLWK